MKKMELEEKSRKIQIKGNEKCHRLLCDFALKRDFTLHKKGNIYGKVSSDLALFIGKLAF